MSNTWQHPDWLDRPVREVLEHLRTREQNPSTGHPESPFYARREDRWDHDCITRLIPEGASVLDLGCGSGELLNRLRKQKQIQAQGVERDARHVAECLDRGVPVIQRDIDEGLSGFSDQSFDYVVVEETLQTVHLPDRLLREALRVGRVCVVSFPNFGHWRAAAQLLLQGTMPISYHLPFAWHDTPNIHLLTIKDFQHWCDANGVVIRQAFGYCDGEYHPLRDDDNVNAEEAMFEISRQG